MARPFDERDPAVMRMVAQAIRDVRRRAARSAVSARPLRLPGVRPLPGGGGIDSISLNPDSVVRTTLAVLEMERKDAAAAPERVAAPPPVVAAPEPVLA